VLRYFFAPTGKVGNPYLQAGDNLVSDGVWQLVFEPLFYFNYERGPARDVIGAPRHPYTRELVESVPTLEPR
jgi:ABC-type antimicrobial peptide transport system ATPase subunit